MICLLTACLFFPLGDGCAKYLSQTLPVTEVTWVRYLGNLLLLAPFTLYHHGSKGFLPQRFLAQLFRGLVLVLTTFLFFSAIQTVPITDAQIVFFINPLLVVLIAAIILREKLTLSRVLAVLVGFAGVFLVVRPGFKEFQIETVYAFGAASCFSRHSSDQHPHPLSNRIKPGYHVFQRAGGNPGTSLDPGCRLDLAALE